jgi:hypothetical protein
MLTIRQQQVEIFRQQYLQRFEDEMLVHLKTFSPRHSKVAGDEAVRRVIRLGIKNAENYGLTNRGSVRFYIELMFMFGSYFDTDPQYPWAASILNKPSAIDQSIRADGLYYATNQYLAHVSGPNHTHLFQAMRRLQQARIEDFVVPGKSLEEGVLQGLHAIYPEKCDYVGESALKHVMRNGLDIAQTYSFTTDKGKVLMTALAFAVGHGFPKDPLCSWIGKRLEDTRRTDPAKLVDDLHSKALLYLDHILGKKENSNVPV